MWKCCKQYRICITFSRACFLFFPTFLYQFIIYSTCATEGHYRLFLVSWHRACNIFFPPLFFTQMQLPLHPFFMKEKSRNPCI